MSAPPEHTDGPRDHNKPNKRRQWSPKQNKEVVDCYYMAKKWHHYGYQKRMHGILQNRSNSYFTEQRLCDQNQQIADKTLLTKAKISFVRLQVENFLQQNPEPDPKDPEPENLLQNQHPDANHPSQHAKQS